MKIKLETSTKITINTGAPQGCVLSPVLFVLHTNDLCSKFVNVKILKDADDTLIVVLISINDGVNYHNTIMNVKSWCYDHNLDLNVSKTKELGGV